ncbi:alpha/beta fold hydrolase, partial [Kitasatospora sp. NPDC056327]|uniref:alpha/beta fold hydrolase n=1 Tax=Kitasatospora sp. NPDC056327 TaxID=3345785 RepID=UPI0035DBD5E8
GDPARLVGRIARATGAQVVVAHSFAALALLEHLASPRPADLEAAVLVSPFYRPRPGDFDWATLAHYLEDFHLILDEGLRVSAEDRLDAATRRAMALRVRERIGPYGWTDFFGAYLRTPSLALERVRPPVLVVAGRDDLAARPADARALAAALPRARLEVLPGCGHFPMAEQPERFTRLLEDFLTPAAAATAAAVTHPPLETT